MRSRHWPHAFLALAVIATWRIAAGQVPAPNRAAPPHNVSPLKPKPKAPSSQGSASGSGAGSAELTTLPTSNVIPDFAPGPAKFSVTPFENHVVHGASLDWIIAEAPFEIAEKTESALGLDPTNPPLYVPGERVPAEPDTVAAFGKATGAQYVITGWFDRPSGSDPNIELRLDVIVWTISATKGGVVAKNAGEAQRMGKLAGYHKLLGDVVGEAWTKAGVTVDLARAAALSRPLSPDIYPVFMMGRGLGYLTGAIAAMADTDTGSGSGSGAGSAFARGPDLKAAEHDLERAVFLDPKLYEGQRLVGEVYMATVPPDPKLVARASGKFNYASDLAPDDIASLRAAAFSMAAAGKWEVALEMFRRLVIRKPWDLELRYQLGRAMWQVGDAPAAQHQLEQVTARLPDHLAARRVLVLIHASHSDTKRLITELEAIAARAPDDLETKADLATAYGALGDWSRAVASLEQVAQARPNDMALLVRVGDGHRKNHDLEGALQWYARAQRLEPTSSLPGFAIAQALYDANRLADAVRAYTNLQKYWMDLPAAEEALGAIALVQNRPTDAAWYLRRAVHEAPRNLATRQAVIAAELMRKDPAAALAQLGPALAMWPQDGTLHYLAGIAHHLSGDSAGARTELAAALQATPGLASARSALSSLDAGGGVTLEFKPELARPWGDGDALQEALDRYGMIAATMATVRVEYQGYILGLLGALGVGPQGHVKPGSVKSCPVAIMAKPWSQAQQALHRYERLGVDLEAAYRFIARHDEIGLTAGLLPNARTAVAAAKKSFRQALADVGELRSEFTRGLGPELRVVGCNDRLLAAAVADPSRYRVIEEDQPEAIPTTAPLRAKPRSTFFVDNTRCVDPVDVWIDGSLVGQVSPGRRSALVADGGERTLCLLGPGAAQCGDRGTVRQVYLHDGWSVTMYCPK